MQMSAFPAFINHLFAILEAPSNHKYVHWSADGRSIVIPDQHTFTRNVLPRYFNHSNFSSFVRQLNKYGFSKTKHALNGTCEFRQDNFVKEKPFLTSRIRRNKGGTLLKSIHTLQTAVNHLYRDVHHIKSMLGITSTNNIDNIDNVSNMNNIDNVSSVSNIDNVSNTMHRHAKSVIIVEDTKQEQAHTAHLVSMLSFTLARNCSEADILIASERAASSDLIQHFIDSNKTVVICLDTYDERKCHEYLRAGVSDVIIKPYKTDTLARLLSKYSM